MKILITGGMGFVGSNLSEYLIGKGHEVVIFSRSKGKARNIDSIRDSVKVELGDISDFGRLEEVILETGPDVIYHFAGQLTTYESFEKPLYDVDVNSKSTIAMLESIRKLKNPCKFILGSTFWVVGNPETLPINEETPCNPLNVYAANRLASEHYCRIYKEVHDLDAMVLRLTNTFGIKEQYDNPKKAALNNLIYKGFKGQAVPIYDGGEFFRDYVYVSDVVTAAEVIMDKGKSGECYFVGTGEKTWFYDIGKWIEELTDGKVEYIESPDYHKRINVGNIVIDNAKIRSLGWDWKVSVKEGIKKVLDYYNEIESSEGV
jgi:UDP-glucose 4-epimerase